MTDFEPLDLSGIEDQTGLAAGEYEVTCVHTEVRTTKAGNGKYIAAKFTVLGSPLHLFHNFNIVNPSEVAQKIGLGQLKAFLKVSGYKSEILKDVWDMINLKCLVKVKIESNDFGDQARITMFKPIKGVVEAAKGPF